MFLNLEGERLAAGQRAVALAEFHLLVGEFFLFLQQLGLGALDAAFALRQRALTAADLLALRRGGLSLLAFQYGTIFCEAQPLALDGIAFGSDLLVLEFVFQFPLAPGGGGVFSLQLSEFFRDLRGAALAAGRR